MKNVFIFDVDGTLTDSRSPMDTAFRKWFKDWLKRGSKEVYLASGSDYVKTQEQVNNDILNSVDAVFSCAGNAIYVKGQLKYKSEWTLKEPQISWLNEQLFKSLFTGKVGRHIEIRTGLVNFSVVGRAADKDQRAKYVEFDKKNNERKRIADLFNKKFEGIAVAQVAGETGIDLMEPKKDKGQIAQYFVEPGTNVYFFGDQMKSGGNDYPLGEALKRNYIDSSKGRSTVIEVRGWKDTWNYLQKMENR